MQFPIGFDNFNKIRDSQLYFVDKSLFIKEILDDKGSEVLVITRPRRFGKTLNLSMLHHFLTSEVDGILTKPLFEGLNIIHVGGDYLEHQGKYPVIFITLKNVRNQNFEGAYAEFYELITSLYKQFRFLLEADTLYDEEKNDFKAILNKTAGQTQVKFSLKNLSEYLYRYYRIKPWILIDEYDTPIQAGHMHGYYQNIIEFMQGMLGAALKTNPSIHRAVLTGILRISKESLFSALNNPAVHTLLSKPYSTHFGFTESEIEEILKEAKLKDQAAAIKEWYNGYLVGSTVMYNPWSIANCIAQQGLLKPYWVNTSDNHLVRELIVHADSEFKKGFELILRGEPVAQIISEHTVFSDLKTNPASIWSLLLLSGYLKATRHEYTDQGLQAVLAIPNHEVKILFREIIEQWLSGGYGIAWYNSLIGFLIKGEAQNFIDGLKKTLLHMSSFHDMAKDAESFYHGYALGLFTTLQMGGTHEVKSNKESGFGRYDVMIIPKNLNEIGIILEFKTAKSEEHSLQKSAQEALSQINHKQYEVELKAMGVQKILKLGLAFQGKEVEGFFEYHQDK